MKSNGAQVFIDHDKPMFGLSVKPLPPPPCTTHNKKKTRLNYECQCVIKA